MYNKLLFLDMCWLVHHIFVVVGLSLVHLSCNKIFSIFSLIITKFKL